MPPWPSCPSSSYSPRCWGRLLVADAGYYSFVLAKRLVEHNVSFLLRMSSNVTLYTTRTVALQNYREGLVYYFPDQKKTKLKDACVKRDT